jgi:hypothetical protein
MASLNTILFGLELRKLAIEILTINGLYNFCQLGTYTINALFDFCYILTHSLIFHYITNVLPMYSTVFYKILLIIKRIIGRIMQ